MNFEKQSFFAFVVVDNVVVYVAIVNIVIPNVVFVVVVDVVTCRMCSFMWPRCPNFLEQM
jgi:hypothetical protein